MQYPARPGARSALLAGAVVLSAALLTGCSGGTVTVTGTAAPAVTVTTVVTAGSASPTVAAPTSTEGSSLALKDGEYPVLLKKVDVAGRTLTVDVIQVLTGEEAEKHSNGQPVTDDYLIVNESKRLRTLPLTAGALTTTYDPDDLSAQKAVSLATVSRTKGNYTYWIMTVRSGQVVILRAEFTP